MTVQELIEQLSKFDPNTEVLGTCTDPSGYTYKVSIQSIELNNPYDDNGYSGVDGSEMDDWGDCYVEDEETGVTTYVGPNVVLINIGEI
jgi:hypothetical protein